MQDVSAQELLTACTLWAVDKGSWAKMSCDPSLSSVLLIWFLPDSIKAAKSLYGIMPHSFLCSLRFGYIDEVGAFISEAGLETFLQTRDGSCAHCSLAVVALAHLV